jgi:hypothetical protein
LRARLRRQLYGVAGALAARAGHLVRVKLDPRFDKAVLARFL